MFDPAPDCGHNARSFMAHNNGLAPRKRIMVGMAESRRFHNDQHFVFKGFLNNDFTHLKTSFTVCYGCPALFAHIVLN
jgi:hypothetical protein